jgi:ABC-2 type transport system permease protein
MTRLHVSTPASYAWFAAHEFRLAWRDWLSMLTAGKPGRVGALAVGIGLFVIFMHVLALIAVGPLAARGIAADRTTLAVLGAFVLLAWCLMISQAMESVTRAFYSRADLDLILSSPVEARRLFAVRIVTLAFSAMGMAILLAGPFANVLTVLDGPRWIAGYAVFAALGMAAAAIAITVTIFLFRLIGPKRTRFVAQVFAAVIGAGFVIGLQIGAIFGYGSFSRTAVIFSDAFIQGAPEADSIFYLPVLAILGDWRALVIVLATGVACLGLAIALFASRFGEHALTASSTAPGTRRIRTGRPFRAATPERALRRKEWTLLRRDPWLMSQTLMQILYLGPPALLLWRNFGADGGIDLLLVPVLVMAAGQLAGGLAWLAISGEDAPELVATAPVPRGFVMRAKVEAVLMSVAIVFTPLLLVFAFVAPASALATAWFAGVAAVSATAIQYWFRAQAKRSQFRRRHTSSRVATFGEAFSSIGWAATAALAAHGSWTALVVALLTLGVLAVTRFVSPHRHG